MSLCSHHGLTARSSLRDGFAFILVRVTHTSFALPARQTSTDTAGPQFVLAALSLSALSRAAPMAGRAQAMHQGFEVGTT